MERITASLRRIRHLVIAVAAVLVVWSSTPFAQVLKIATDSIPAEKLFVLSNNRMWNVDTGTQAATGGWSPCSPGTSFSFPPAVFNVDLAPDGLYYGVGPVNCSGGLAWGIMNPDAVYGTSPGLIGPPAQPIPFRCDSGLFGFCRWYGVMFVKEVPEPGAPVGYRFEQREGTGGKVSNGPFTSTSADVFAVDSLIPYREHLALVFPLPGRYNFSIGASVIMSPGGGSQVDRTSWAWTTTDAVYTCGSGCGAPTQVGFLAAYRLSRQAFVVNSNSGDAFYIADGGRLLHFAQNQVDLFTPPSLSQIVAGGRRAPLPGGVHFEPDDTIFVDEFGTTATKAVSLTYAPTSNVTISFSSSDTTHATVNPSSLTFTPSNWNVPQTITITGVDDGIAGNGPQSFVLQTAPLSSSDPVYSGRIVRSFAGITQEGAGPTITPLTGVAVPVGTNLTVNVATVADADQAPGSLNVAVEPATHVTTLAPVTNNNGTISATVNAPCNAWVWANEPWTLDVTDANGNKRSDRVEISVLSSSLGTYPNREIDAGSSGTITPSAPPFGVLPPTVTTSGFGGYLSVDSSTGIVYVTNAGPRGNYTMTVSAPGTCSSTPTQTFTLTVGPLPTITAGTPITLEQGSAPASGTTVATVADPVDDPNSLTVTATNVPTGITIDTITNSGGTITANITAGCGAAAGANPITLQVTDSAGLSATVNFIVNVTSNPAPTLGTYQNVIVSPGGGTTVTPTAGPSDDQAINSLTITAPGFTGTLSIDSTTGVVTIGNANVGSFVATVAATDACSTTNRTFVITADNAPTITAAAPITAAQGSVLPNTAIATVSDSADAAGSLTVTATSVPAGITIGSIANANGNITATAGTGCATAAGAYPVTLQVTNSSGLTATATFTVNVSGANTAPTLGAYPGTSGFAGSTFTVTPNATPADNGTVTISASAPGFTGTFSGNPSTGVITIANAGPPGNYTVTVNATDNCGAAATPQTFALTLDAPPAIVAAPPVTVQQGSPEITATVATVSDLEDPAGSLAVGASDVPPGIAIDTITNTNGTITANVGAVCGSTIGANTITLGVTDSAGASATVSFTINVTANTPPVLGAYPTTGVAPGGGATATPNAVPTDNGGVSSINVSAPGFTGTASADPTTGVLTITNAGPLGVHPITLTAIDNCGTASTGKTCIVIVDNPPTITAGSAITRQQGSAATGATLATVSDSVDSAGSISVTATSVPTGITIGAITNSNGTITANVSASCAAAPGANTVTLQATNSAGMTSTASFTVNVTTNTPPTIGSYSASSMGSGSATTINPSAPPSDNGTVTVTASASQGFTGSISTNSSTGAISISNAGPVGTYTIAVTATDNCGATASTTFSLTVWDCRTTIAPAFVNVSSAAGSGSISVTAHAGCSWTAASNGFVTITSGSSGSGNGTVTYSYTQNTAQTGRSTSLVVAGTLFNVTQSAAGVSTFPMTATASVNQVSVVWSAVAGASSYQVHRSDGFIAAASSTSYNDTAVTPGNGYVYQVWAIGSGNLIAYSNPDLAVPFAYTNAAVAGGVIQAVDFTELRQAANAALAAVGLPAMPFSGAISAGTTIEAVHLTEIRSAVDQARAAVGLAPVGYTDPTVTSGSTIIRAAHVQELRSGLQ